MDDELFSKEEQARSPKSKVSARCPACSANVPLRDTAEVWDPVNCPECDTALEVVNLRPPTLDFAPPNPESIDWEEVDWEDEWEDDERSGKKNKKKRKKR